MLILHKIQELQMKWVMLMGTITGSMYSWFMNHWSDMLLTVVLAILGTIASGLTKLLIDRLSRKKEHNDGS